ncbi:MAG: DUF4350 domain-containing protein [Candidatus Accumulibacter sp.]|jgi:hypothetical protein|nr:DUF4350 domain-containing protein [Accumulibacter sp.]
MSRRVIWSLLTVTALVTLATLWFLQNFERVPVKTYESMQREARRNPYLAAERLFSRLGRTVTRIDRPAALDALEAGGVLILERGHRRVVDQERARRLLEWVAHGAYLIVEAESDGDDPLLRALGAKYDELYPDPASCVEAVLPGSDLVYKISAWGQGLTAGKLPPDWRVSGPDKDLILHYGWGRGNIAVVGSMTFLYNWNLGDFDHAELAWAMLRRYQPDGVVYLAARLEHRTLWQWLAEFAWRALISVAALVVLWLWFVAPRFGGARAAPDAARRDLAQHLLAIGRSLWREGGLGHLRDIARREIAQRLTQRHPTLARRPPGERHDALARIADLDGRKIAEALADEQTPSPETFTRAMQTLQHLEHKL